jgi:hypothetical protein
MLLGKLPFAVSTAGPKPLKLSVEDLSFLNRLTNGAALETIVRRAFGIGTSRFSSAEEFLEVLDAWERRVALPVAKSSQPKMPIAPAKGSSPATWDLLCDEFSGGTKRLDVILDAAEQMRQSVEPERPVGVTPPPQSSKWPELQRVAPKGAPKGPVEVRVVKSVGPKSRRRPVSIGPELAAFAARSRPKLKPWLVGGGITAALAFVGLNLWSYLSPKVNGSSATETRTSLSTETDSSRIDRERPTERPKLSAREATTQCITSYFRDGALQKDVDLGFVCTDEDFLSVNHRLHEESMNQITTLGPDGGVPLTAAAASVVPSAPPGASPPSSATSGTLAEPPAPAVVASANRALVVRSGATTLGWQLGWYELVATAIIRQNCCKEAAPIKLPETTGWCQQMQSVVRRIASDSAKIGDISPAVRSFDEAVTCLSAQGKHVVYPYKAVPTNLQKAAFQQFLKHAAEADAKRSSRR